MDGGGVESSSGLRVDTYKGLPRAKQVTWPDPDYCNTAEINQQEGTLLGIPVWHCRNVWDLIKELFAISANRPRTLTCIAGSYCRSRDWLSTASTDR